MNGSPATVNERLGRACRGRASRVASPPASRASGGMRNQASHCTNVRSSAISSFNDRCIASPLFSLGCQPSERIRRVSRRTTGTSPLPATISAGVFEARLRAQPQALHGHLSDLSYRHRVVGRHVEDGEALLHLLERSENRIDHIGDMHVALALLDRPRESAETLRIYRSARRTKSKPTPCVCRAPTDVGEAKRTSRESEHRAVACDERFSGELACAVRRHRLHADHDLRREPCRPCHRTRHCPRHRADA